jgi:hypothetical protein
VLISPTCAAPAGPLINYPAPSSWLVQVVSRARGHRTTVTYPPAPSQVSYVAMTLSPDGVTRLGSDLRISSLSLALEFPHRRRNSRPDHIRQVVEQMLQCLRTDRIDFLTSTESIRRCRSKTLPGPCTTSSPAAGRRCGARLAGLS